MHRRTVAVNSNAGARSLTASDGVAPALLV